MRLICLSVTHHNTPVDLREQLNLTFDGIDAALLSAPIREGEYLPIREVVFLSTCNRLETYALVDLPDEDQTGRDATYEPLLTYLSSELHVPTTAVEPYLRKYHDDETVAHLFQVAAGLDSIALGEAQILGQVSQALDNALQNGTAHHVLDSLFRSAIHAGKRVQNETEIGRKPVSLSAVAVQLAQTHLSDLTNRAVLVIGAGKMGGYALDALKERGVSQIVIANRTHQRAQEWGEKYGGTALSLDHLQEGLAHADLVFTSTAAAHPILTREQIQSVMAGRDQRPLTLIDLAVPRNVDPGVRDLPGVTLFDMDDLQAFAASAGTRDHAFLRRARAIVAQETEDYAKLLRVVPFIGELHRKVEQIRQNEVTRALKHLDAPDPRVTEQIDLLSRILVRKILHEPTMRLRAESDQAALDEYVRVLSRLFDIEDTHPALFPQREVA